MAFIPLVVLFHFVVARAIHPRAELPPCPVPMTGLGYYPAGATVLCYMYWWVWMVVRFVCVIRVPVCARVPRVCPVCVSRLPRVSLNRYQPVCVPGSPRCF
jgi:hypothetical protein